MTTSNVLPSLRQAASPPTPQDASTGERAPLRLRLAAPGSRGALDGAWWPQSHGLDLELVDLIDNFPAAVGRIDHVVVSPPDWGGSVPRRVLAERGYVKVGSYPHDDTKVVLLVLAGGAVMRVLVVPSQMTADQALGAMRTAAGTGNRSSGHNILRTAPDWAASDSTMHWNDDGGSWWDPHPSPPSERAGAR
jgi:hypothetical protein